MPIAAGCHHIALLTRDLDAFIAFYREVFAAEVVVDQQEGPLRHAIVHLGGGFNLHPFQLPEATDHADGRPGMFSRGHLDHLAIDLPDAATFEAVRARLVRTGASDGTARDFGMVKICGFRDPDGMEAEIALRQEGPALTRADSRVEAFEPA